MLFPKSSHQSITFQYFTGSNYFPNLDWIRALAILAVIFHHIPQIDGFIEVFKHNCRYGVSLFFVVSGFLICSLLIREKNKNGNVRLRDFYIRRGLRLFPLYFTVLFLYVVVVLLFNQFSLHNQDLFLNKLPFHLTYTSNWTKHATQGPFFFSWSLAVEEQFYLAFSIVFVYLTQRNIILIITIAIMIKYLINVMFSDHGNLITRIFFSYSEPILYGVLAAYAVHTKNCFQRLKILTNTLLLTILSSCLVILITIYEVHNKSELAAQFLYILMTVLVVGVALRPKLPIIGNPLFIHIGKISYGIYLLHMLFIMATQKLITSNPWFIFIISTSSVIIAASLVYWYFEKPILNYKRHFSRI